VYEKQLTDEQVKNIIGDYVYPVDLDKRLKIHKFEQKHIDIITSKPEKKLSLMQKIKKYLTGE
jgi:hypothetical protein